MCSQEASSTLSKLFSDYVQLRNRRCATSQRFIATDRQYLATPTLLFQIGISTPRANHWSSIIELVLIVFGALRFHFAGIFELLRGENRPHPENRTERKEAGLLGPTKSRLGSNLAVLGLKVPNRSPLGPNLGVICAELGPVGSNLGSTLSPTGVQHGAAWARTQVGLSMRNLVLCVFVHLAPKLGRRQAQRGPNWSPSWHQLAMLGWSWAQSDPDRLQIEAFIAHGNPSRF